MRAAILRQFGEQPEVQDVQVDEPREGEVLVRLVASGVCHSDLHAVDGILRPPLPVILGHEGAGIVERVGPGVTLVGPGDHVVLAFVAACGHCAYCTVGRPNLCARRARLSGVMRDGTARFRWEQSTAYHFMGVSSFAEYTVVPEAGAIPVRKDAPLETVCLIGCGVMTGVGAAVNTAKVRPGSSVLVVGCGGVGLSVVQGAAIAGAHPIIAADLLAHKLSLARDLGATHTINSGQQNLVTEVMELTGGSGVEYAFEVISTAATIRQAFDALRPGGMCVVVGAAPPGTEVPIPTGALLQERILTGSAYGSARMAVDIPKLVDLYMEGKLKLEPLVSRRLSLDEIGLAFDLLRRGEVARAVIHL